jgi:KDO2-lipid IV(A) lauroyltransferase
MNTARPKTKRKKGKLHPAFHGPVYAGVRAMIAGVNVAGVDRTMRAFSDVARWFALRPANRKRLDRAMDNIAWCFPDWDEARVRETAINAYCHLFCLGAEMAVTTRYVSRDGYARRVEVDEIGEPLAEIINDRPTLLITGHCGNWELLGYSLASLGFPIHALYRPLDMKPLDRWVQETRRSRGLMLVDKFGASTMLPKLIESGETVGFIADQNAGDQGTHVPFFGRLASAYKTIGLLALKYEASIVCGCAHRVGGMVDGEFKGGDDASRSFHYRIRTHDVIRPEDWADKSDPLFYITARYRRAIELMVRESPEQYLWMHRVWKSRPPHERKGRPFPDRLLDKCRELEWMDESDIERMVDRSRIDAAELQRLGVSSLK